MVNFWGFNFTCKVVFSIFPRKLILPPQPIVKIPMFSEFINNDLSNYKY